MQKKPKTPFEVEELRTKLTKRHDLKEFFRTYTSNYPEIPDLNTAKLWDNLNEGLHMEWKISPMTTDKLKIISDFIPDKSIKVLNIGCGRGDLENEVFNKKRKLKLDWTGLDISPKSIKTCKSEFPNAFFSLGDIRKLKFKDNTFDLIVLMEILEHIRPRETFKALKEVKRVLKGSGKLIVSIPMNEGLHNMIKMGKNPNAHVRTYTPEIIRAELKLSGFKINEEITLIAFPNWYRVKTFIAKYLLPGIRKPNNMVIFARKI